MAPSKNKKIKQTFTLFIVTFLVSLIVITYFIKSFSPNVDVEIGGESTEYSENNTSESDVKQAIDDRLKWIQMEDNSPATSDDNSNSSNEESVKKAEKATATNNKHNEGPESVELITTPQKQLLAPPVPAVPVKQVEPPKMAKVYVGNYPTIEAAILAQNKLMDSSTNVSPFVKEVNGNYVLQAGSYSNTSTAESVAKEISALGFQVRIVRE